MPSCRFFVRGIQKDGQYFEYTFIRPKFYFEPGRALPHPGQLPSMGLMKRAVDHY